MAENRETYIAGEGDAAPAHTESTMRDMDRMLDDTLGGTSTAGAGSADIDVEYTGSGPGGTGTADPDATRAEIEQTRVRMSETIDEIEDALLRKKENIQDRLNVFGPVKENPLPSVGIVFGAGLLLGYLTGEDDDDDNDQVHHRHVSTEDDEFWVRRASDWEARARRLLDLAKRQEVELSELRGRHEMATAATAGAAVSGAGTGAAMGAAGAPSGAAWRSSSPSTGTGAGASRDTYSPETYEVTLEDQGEDRWERLSSPLRKVGDTVVEGLTSFLARTTRELSGTQHR